MKLKKTFWLKLLRDISILIFLLIAVHLYQTRNTPEITPPLNGVLLNGKPFEMSSQKKPLLIYFWGSWCPLCSITSSTINDMAQNYSIVTIAYASGNALEVENYMQENKLSFPVINDESGIISQSWKVHATPMFYIINTNNEISSVTVGLTSSLGLKVRLWWASIL